MKKQRRKSNVTSLKAHERQLINMKIERAVKDYFMMDDPDPCDQWKPARWYYDQYCLCGSTDCSFKKFSSLAKEFCERKKMKGKTNKAGTAHYKLNGHTLGVIKKRNLVMYGRVLKKAV